MLKWQCSGYYHIKHDGTGLRSKMIIYVHILLGIRQNLHFYVGNYPSLGLKNKAFTLMLKFIAVFLLVRDFVCAGDWKTKIKPQITAVTQQESLFISYFEWDKHAEIT